MVDKLCVFTGYSALLLLINQLTLVSGLSLVVHFCKFALMRHVLFYTSCLFVLLFHVRLCVLVSVLSLVFVRCVSSLFSALSSWTWSGVGLLSHLLLSLLFF